MNSRATIVFGFLAVMCTSRAQAWNVNTCDGKVVGSRSFRTYVMDRCNIPAGSQRESDLFYVFGQWNLLDGIADRFGLSAGDSDCVLEGEDAVAYVTRDSIDGLSGLTTWTDKPCFWPFGNNGDGRRFDIRMRVVREDEPGGLPLGPRDSIDTNQAARMVWFHEMGHALGGNHWWSLPNMMADPAAIPRVGKWTAAGGLTNSSDSFTADDVHFGAQWHGGTGGAEDMAASAQWYDGTNQFNVNSLAGGTAEVLLTRCPGQSVLFAFVHANLGKNNVSCGSPYSASFVLSSDSTISALDTTVRTWSICADRGQSFMNTDTFTVPFLSPGTYRLGMVVDPSNVRSEANEGNNAVYLNTRVTIPSGC